MSNELYTEDTRTIIQKINGISETEEKIILSLYAFDLKRTSPKTISEAVKISQKDVIRHCKSLCSTGLALFPQMRTVSLTPNGIVAGELLLIRLNAVKQLLGKIDGEKHTEEQSQRIAHAISVRTAIKLADYLNNTPL